jgi:hypothetical protein
MAERHTMGEQPDQFTILDIFLRHLDTDWWQRVYASLDVPEVPAKVELR